MVWKNIRETNIVSNRNQD